MCGPMCPRPIRRKAPAAQEDEAAADAAPAAVAEAVADGLIPAAAAGSSRRNKETVRAPETVQRGSAAGGLVCDAAAGKVTVKFFERERGLWERH